MQSNDGYKYSRKSAVNAHNTNIGKANKHSTATTNAATIRQDLITMKTFNNILSLAAGASALALPAEIEKRADQRFDSNVRSIITSKPFH